MLTMPLRIVNVAADRIESFPCLTRRCSSEHAVEKNVVALYVGYHLAGTRTDLIEPGMVTHRRPETSVADPGSERI